MSASGKQIRLGRFFYPHSRLGMIVPMDHGLTIGPVEGLKNVSEIANWIGHPGITGIIAHKGMAERLGARGLLRGMGVIIHLNGMSTLSGKSDQKELLTSVETAICLGADAVSVQVNFDGSNDAHNLKLLGTVVDEAQSCGLPVLTMLYDKVLSEKSEQRIHRMRHLMRVTMELGTDLLKIGAPDGGLGEIPPLLEGLSEDVPIFFAGGMITSDTELVALTECAIQHGGAGLCVGRNVFQRPSPMETLNRLSSLLIRAGHRVPRASDYLAMPEGFPLANRH
jgi:fructose-bisphosphate aldolase, class I